MAERVSIAMRRKELGAPEESWEIHEGIERCRIDDPEGFDTVLLTGEDEGGVVRLIEYPLQGDPVIHEITASSGKKVFRYLVAKPRDTKEFIVFTFNMNREDAV